MKSSRFSERSEQHQIDALVVERRPARNDIRVDAAILVFNPGFIDLEAIGDAAIALHSIEDRFADGERRAPRRAYASICMRTWA